MTLTPPSSSSSSSSSSPFLLIVALRRAARKLSMPPVIDHFGRTHFELEYMHPNATAPDYPSKSFTINEIFAISMLPVILIGLFGNGASIYVYSRKHMKKSTVGFLLLSLSIVDFLLLLSALPTFALYKFPFFPGYNKIGSTHTIISAFSIVYIYPIGCTAKMISQYIIVLIAVERWFAVCRPLQVQVWCTLENTIKAMIYIVLFATVFNFPRFLEFTADLSTGIVNMGLSHSANNNWYFVLYYGIRSIVFDTVIPFLVISITNIQVIKQLKKSNEERKMLTSQQQKDKKTTTMLLVMVILYAICHMFNTSLKFVNLIFKTYAQFQFTLVRILHHVSNMLLFIYSTSTFFIYLIFSMKYRQVISALVSCQTVEEVTSSSRGSKPKTQKTSNGSASRYTGIQAV